MAGIRLAAKNGNKAGKWLQGRKDVFKVMEGTLRQHEKRIWVHCASLGEFEQARPIIEKLKSQRPEYSIVLTFFSPSGYEVRKDYDQADYVFYLPMDSARNASRFLELVQPVAAVWVKYEFWYYYLQTLHQRAIPTILVSAAFRPSQPFFRWYGGLFRKMLGCYTHIFVQDASSQQLLAHIGIKNHVTAAGDTRYDRVAAIAAQAQDFPVAEAWKGQSRIFIAGSTWKDDEQLLKSALHYMPADWKMILAPHEIHEVHLQEIEALFAGMTVRYSQLKDPVDSLGRVLLIDNIGMLSSLYRLGDMAFVGGGFGSGIHNILEPAVYGLPVFFGPNYTRFIEARTMVEKNLAFPVSNESELKQHLVKLFGDTGGREKLSSEIKRFVQTQLGATDKVLAFLYQILPIENAG